MGEGREERARVRNSSTGLNARRGGQRSMSTGMCPSVRCDTAKHITHSHFAYISLNSSSLMAIDTSLDSPSLALYFVH